MVQNQVISAPVSGHFTEKGEEGTGEKEDGDTAADVGPLCVLSRIPCGLSAARAPKIISGVPVPQRRVHELLYNAVPWKCGTCSFILLKNKHQSTAPPVKNCACSEVLRNLVYSRSCGCHLFDAWIGLTTNCSCIRSSCCELLHISLTIQIQFAGTSGGSSSLSTKLVRLYRPTADADPFS